MIRDIVLRNLEKEGNYPTSIEGLYFIRRDTSGEFAKCFYKPACIFVLQGQKQLIFSSKTKTYKKGQYVLSCTDIPAICRVDKASEKEPFVAILIEFNSKLINDIILETGLSFSKDKDFDYLSVAESDDNLTDAFYRLVQLVEQPYDEILFSMIIKEIYYRLLSGPLGNQLALINANGTSSNRIMRAISFLKENYRQKLSIDNLAQQVNMASSSFYRNFKKITQVSPLQYQKQLRLCEAQKLMLSGEYNAESASYYVGYESPTQFSREYKKMFGNSPKKDIKKLGFV